MTPSRLEVIPASDHERWNEVLHHTDGFDVYHLAEYHLLSERAGEGKGVLFVLRESSKVIAWPFLLRPIEQIEGLENEGAGLFDATSVYGYPGPVLSVDARNDEAFMGRFGAALHSLARELHLVTLFSRTHPLLNNCNINFGIGAAVPLGDTVSIDLTESEEIQWSKLHTSHRYHINRGRARGVRVFRDQAWDRFDDFLSLYEMTMRRVNAAQKYFFDREYFMRLRAALGDRVQLFVAEVDNVICGTGLFFHAGPFVQYHLSGNHSAYAKLTPTKLIINEARKWGKVIGARILHLGGGVGARNDSLFHFKEGFSQSRHPFSVWQLVVDPSTCARLDALRRQYLNEHNSLLPGGDYFPKYRSGE